MSNNGAQGGTCAKQGGGSCPVLRTWTTSHGGFGSHSGWDSGVLPASTAGAGPGQQGSWQWPNEVGAMVTYKGPLLG